MKHTLNQEDVSRLLLGPSATVRAETAGKIATQFERGEFTAGEREIAEQIFRAMVKDAEVRVREALSKNLKECDELPHDVALILARDVDQVARPMLEFSQVLTDEDLIEIVRTQSAAKQEAIARRPAVSERVVDALVSTDHEPVVAALVANEGAELSEISLQRVLDRFPDSDAVKEPMTHRRALPITVAERLVSLVSHALKEYLVAHHELSDSLASDLVLQSRERATVGLLSEDSDARDVADLVSQLKANGRLTPTIVLRALCMGDIAFFEASMAILANIPVANTRLLVHDEGPLGLRAIYDKAGFPEPLFPAMRIAIDVIDETDFDGGPNDRERYTCRVLERILTQFEDLGSIGPDNLDYLIAKLGRMGTTGVAA